MAIHDEQIGALLADALFPADLLDGVRRPTADGAVAAMRANITSKTLKEGSSMRCHAHRNRNLIGAVVSTLVFSTPAAAVLDGRTSEELTGDRELTGQLVRTHLSGEEGRCIRVVAAGVRTRNAYPAPLTAEGTIVLPPGPTQGNVVWAGLYWVILSDTEPLNNVTLNGAPVVPVPLPVTLSPCWPETYAYVYFAEVTSLVLPGGNVVAGFDDSGLLAIGPESEGVSLVVVYEAEGSSACEIIVTDGNDLLDRRGQQFDNPLPVTCGTDLPATLTFIGADGQTGTHGYAPDDQIWDGTLLGNRDDFNASDPDAPDAEPDLSWDTDPWQVTTSPTNIASVAIPFLGGPGDCVNWVATVLEVGVHECLPTPATETSWGRIRSWYR